MNAAATKEMLRCHMLHRLREPGLEQKVAATSGLSVGECRDTLRSLVDTVKNTPKEDVLLLPQFKPSLTAREPEGWQRVVFHAKVGDNPNLAKVIHAALSQGPAMSYAGVAMSPGLAMIGYDIFARTQAAAAPTSAPNPLQKLHEQGVSIWLDNLSRNLIDSGELQKGIDQDGLRGETSNPSIFEKAITKGIGYQDQITGLAKAGKTTEEICWELMVSDVRKACDTFRPLYESSNKQDGFVSLEVSPLLAHEDSAKTVAQAKELWSRVGRPNLMIKVPATKEGLPAIEELISQGINVNVTLLFDTKRQDAVAEAYMRGLEKRAAQGLPIDNIASVASFFVSRVDSEVDPQLDKIAAADTSKKDQVDGLHGKVAVANARTAYETFQQRFSGERWKALEDKGAQVQRPLWASTGTKNKAYSDTLYVHELIGPQCVNTAPDETLALFRDHGMVERTLTPESLREAHQVLDQVKGLGVDMDAVSAKLETEGVTKFIDSYRQLLAAVAGQREKALA